MEDPGGWGGFGQCLALCFLHKGKFLLLKVVKVQRKHSHTLGKKRESEKTAILGIKYSKQDCTTQIQLRLRQEKQENVHFFIFPGAWKCISLAENEFPVHLPHSPLQASHTPTHTPQAKIKIKETQKIGRSASFTCFSWRNFSFRDCRVFSSVGLYLKWEAFNASWWKQKGKGGRKENQGREKKAGLEKYSLAMLQKKKSWH